MTNFFMKSGDKSNFIIPKSRKAQTGIIVVVILIILSLVAVVILWNVVHSLLKGSTSQVKVNQFSLTGDMKYYLEPTVNNYINVSVKRGSGEGNINAVKIIFDFSDGTRRTYTNNTVYPLPLETKVYLIDGSYLSPVLSPSNFSKVSKVTIYFITISDGKETPSMEIDSAQGPSSGSSVVNNNPTPTGCTGDGECSAFADTCNDGKCISGNCTKQPKAGSPACDDGNLCTNDVCSAGVCVGTPNTAICNDLKNCNITVDRCSAGVCGMGTQKTCTSPQVCNNATGVCEGCTNDCTPSGATRCSGNNVETCGNYDADLCLEWGGSTACSGGTPNCVNGICSGSDCFYATQSQNPIHICSYTDLTLINTRLSSNYILDNDIDASQSSDGSFNPIGGKSQSEYYFSGLFNGNKHKISNLQVNYAGYDYIGFFGNVRGGRIHNLTIVNSRVVGNNYVGGLVGRFDLASSIVNCSFSGDVLGTDYVGGLVGGTTTSCCTKTNITSSYSMGNVNSTSNYAGGLIGYSYAYTTINNSYSRSNVTNRLNSKQMIGGFTGYNYGIIYNSYSTGNVTATGSGDYYVGGFTGYNDGSIYNSYTTSKIKNNSRIESFGGFSSYGGSITNSYWYKRTGDPTDCYWGGNNGCTSVATETYFLYGSSAPMNLWDFTNVWRDNSGSAYPTLK